MSPEYSTDRGQKPLLSWESPVLTKKISAVKIKPRDRSPDIFIRSSAPGIATKECDSFGNVFHHHRLRSETLHAMQSGKRCGGDHVTAPYKRGRFPFHCNGPQLIQCESNVIAPAGVIKDARSLIRPARFATPIRRAQRYYALIIHIKELPVQFRLERSRTAPNTCGSKQSRELLANLSLLAQ